MELKEKMETGYFQPLECPNADLAAIVKKSVSPSPDERYAGMDEMAADLQRFLNHEPVRAATDSCQRRLLLWTKRKPSKPF